MLPTDASKYIVNNSDGSKFEATKVDLRYPNGTKITLWKKVVDYIYRAGSWLVSHNLNGWAAETSDFYCYLASADNVGTGAWTLNSKNCSFSVDVTNINKIKVTHTISKYVSEGGNIGVTLKLSSASNASLYAQGTSSGTITLDVSTLSGMQTFNLLTTLHQSNNQSFHYHGNCTVKITNIDVA